MTDKSNETSQSNDEIDLFGILEFLLSGWKIFVVGTVVGAIAGLITAFVWPVKFEASTAIEGAKVMGKELEPARLVLQRIQTPSIYSDQSLAACDVLDYADPATALSEALDATVARESSVVEATVRGRGREDAKRCLASLLDDLRASQKPTFDLQVESARLQLEQVKKELDASLVRKSDILALTQKELDLSKEKLRDIQAFLSESQMTKPVFDINDQKFSASSLMTSTVLLKQAEAYQLEYKIDQLGQRILSKTVATDIEEQIAKLEREVTELKTKLRQPDTQEARNVTPTYSPKQKVEPKRPVIIGLGVLIGAVAALVLLLLSRLASILRSRRKTA